MDWVWVWVRVGCGLGKGSGVGLGAGLGAGWVQAGCGLGVGLETGWVRAWCGLAAGCAPWLARQLPSVLQCRNGEKPRATKSACRQSRHACCTGKLTWLVLGGDPAARSHRVEQFTAL